MTTVFHYTAGHKLPLIAASGQLEQTRALITPRERPVLWFSRNRLWEPTATKAFLFAGSTVPHLPTFDEMAEALGAYRFGLPAADKRLVPWRRLPQRAGIPAREVLHMVDAGVRQGARPADWLGTFVPVPLADLSFEAWSGGVWVPMTLQEGIATSPIQQRKVVSARVARNAAMQK